MIILKTEQFNFILRHGEADYPHECCGLLIGQFEDDKKVVIETFPISNAREEEAKRNRFLITAEEFSRGERHAKQKNLDVVGFYHSHPDHPARPSGFDFEHAWPLYSYIIVSVNRGEATVLSSWELEDDRSEFKSENISQGEYKCQLQ
jgi:proteasome lid subunit RPN8/RPN11